jgi:hypothetical protein
MSTTGLDSWAVDLAEVGPIYPFQGSEVLMVIVGVAIWIIWHIWQVKLENRTFEEDEAKLKNNHSLEEMIIKQNSLQ